ncbi:MAG: hypothetical protein AAB464_00355 [Patescibacteria group bacterium]
MPQIKMVVFDFDGVIVKCRRGEKLWRWFAEKLKIKTPKVFFFLQEIIEVWLDNKLEPVKEAVEAIKKLRQNGYDVGLLTDRSLWSLDIFFSDNNKGINFNSFAFVQTRKSSLNRLVKQLPLNTVFLVSEKTKPNFQMFQGLKRFAAENNIEAQEILIIDDLPQVIELAKTNGFLVPRAEY